MPNDKIEQLKKLLDEGKAFTYKNFASFSGWSSYPTSYKPNYISWRARAKTILESNFGVSSPVLDAFGKGEKNEIRALPL